MKKLTALILSICMLLACTAGLAEEQQPKAYLGTVSINGAFELQCAVPENYTVETIYSTPDELLAILSSENEDQAVMMLSVAFDETYSDVERMNDLDAEALEQLENTFTEDEPDVTITYGETAYGTQVMVARSDTEDLDYLDFLSIYKGYFVEFVLLANRESVDKNLSDEQIQTCVNFLSELDFVPTENIPVGVASETLLASINRYDEKTNSLNITLKTPYAIDPDIVNDLQEGGNLEYGEETVEITAINKEDAPNMIVINDDLELRLNADTGFYNIYQYDEAKVIDFSEVNRPVMDSLVFVDDIDPDSLEMVSDPAEQNAAAFLEKFAQETGENSNGPGFAANNVYVTFDEYGNLIKIERIYVPWQ